MNDIFDNSYNQSFNSNEPKKKKKHVLLISVVAVFCVTLLVCGVSFGISGLNAKKVFTGMLNEMAKSSRDMIAMFPSDAQSGKLTVKEYAKNDGNGAIKSSDTKEEYEVYFNGNQYLISKEGYKALYDKDAEELFVQKVENGKDTGNILKYDDNDFMHSLSDLLYKSRINYIIDDMNLTSQDTEQQKKVLELYAMILESSAKNMKDMYFIDNNKNGIDEYTLKMDKKMISEFMDDVSKDLLNNKNFIELSGISDVDDIKGSLNDFKEELLDYDVLDFSISIFAKGKLENLVGMTFSILAEQDEHKASLVLDLNGTGTKELKNSEEFTGQLVYKNGEELVQADIYLSRKQLYIDGDFESRDYLLSGNDSVNYTKKQSFEFKIVANDNKNLIESSSISATIKASDNNLDETHSLEISIIGDSKESMLDSKVISVNATVDDEHMNGIIRLVADDNKELKNSSKVVLELKIEDDVLKVILEAKDKKAIKDSSNLELLAQADDEKHTILTVIANDNKPIIGSSDIVIKIPEELSGSEMSLFLKAKDKKELFNSSNIEIKIVSEEITMEAEFKGDKAFKEASKIEFEIEVTNGEEEKINVSGYVKSKDNKKFADSKKFEVKLEAKQGDKNYAKFVFDSDNGYEMERTSKRHSSYYGNEENYSYKKLEYLKNVNLDKMMNIKNAKEASYDEILEIIAPGYAKYKKLEEEYYDLLDEYDDLQNELLIGQLDYDSYKKERDPIMSKMSELEAEMDKYDY